jgi:hypothetical protein
VLIECIRADLLVLAADGTFTRPALASRPPGFLRQFEQAQRLRVLNAPPRLAQLHFDWRPFLLGRPQTIRFVLDAGEPADPTPPVIDGVPAAHAIGTLPVGAVLRWRDFVITLREVRLASEAERAMANAARTSDDALRVYCDWLEQHGGAQSAEWARLVLADPRARAARMADLGTRVGLSFRALVARGPVERCAKRCKRGWEELEPQKLPWLRTCATCQETVNWCEDTVRLHWGGPVVIDPSVPREEDDLVPPVHLKI